ncbi:MAG: autotransporter-associated beta strand repeat-containing protein [Opitutaceae bacterium]|jgi:autotransporter-associated beta strand protein
MNISRIQLPLFVAAFAFAAHTSAFAAAYYWDFDADASIGTPAASTAGSGTWNTTITNTNWNLAGSAGSDAAWATNNDAVFAGSDGTYAITVGSALTVGNITFNNSGYTLSAASALKLSQFNAASVVTVATGKTATIGNNVTYENTNGSTLSITGTATAGNPAGTLIIDNGGKVNTTHASAIVYVGSTSNTTLRSTTVQVNAGGTLASASSLVTNGLLKVNGGNVSAGGSGLIGIGNFQDANMVASAILTIDSGSVTTGTSGLRFGASSPSNNTAGGTLNLNGGTLVTPKIFSNSASQVTSTVNFNGGTLKASITNNTDFLGATINNAIVKTGGAVIDTNTFDVTISKALTHDTGLGGTADGGLTKASTGKLTLSAANTYTGDTTISGGTLALASTGSISSSAAIKVGASGIFDVSAVSGYTLSSGQTLRGAGSVTGAVVAGSGSTLAGGIDTSTVGTLTFGSTLDVTAATVSLKLNSTGGTFDVIASNGLTLGNTAILSLADIGPGVWSGTSTFTLLNNTSGTGVIGTFLNLAQGSTINLGSNAFVISYTGGTGNDVTLTLASIPEPSTYAVAFGILALAGASFQRRRRS